MALTGFNLDKHPKIDDGMTVPPGYFASFKESMSQKLPENINAEHPELIRTERISLWTRCRPYVYMAAMFAGVWCMTKMFSIMKHNNAYIPLEENQVLSIALANNDFYNDYVVSSVDEYDLLDGLYEEGVQLTAYNY